MTEEEKTEYEALVEEQRSAYERIKKEHPEWCEQPMTTGVVKDVSEESVWDKLKKFFK